MKHSQCYVLYCGDTVMCVTLDPKVANKYRKCGGRVETRDLITDRNFIAYPWLQDNK